MWQCGGAASVRLWSVLFCSVACLNALPLAEQPTKSSRGSGKKWSCCLLPSSTRVIFAFLYLHVAIIASSLQFFHQSAPHQRKNKNKIKTRKKEIYSSPTQTSISLFSFCLAFRAVIKANCEFFSALFRAVIKNGKSFVFVFHAFVACSSVWEKPRQKQRKCNGTDPPPGPPSVSVFLYFSPIFRPSPSPLRGAAACCFLFSLYFSVLCFFFWPGIDMEKLVDCCCFETLGFRGPEEGAVMTAKSA